MLPNRKPSQRAVYPTLRLVRRAFTTHIVVNARFVDPDRKHATTLDDRNAHVARRIGRFCNVKETPARRYRLWL
jgi:hypothetical protein